MECNGMSVMFFCIILITSSITEAYQMTDQSSQPTKLSKTKNVDITLRCSLLDKHERFNRNANVTWWFKKTCRLSCWNQPEVDKWTEVDCGGSCKLSLDLNDDNASNGFYMCKIFPYKISDQTTLQIEVTKTFQLEIVDPMMAPPPEIINDTPNEFSVPSGSQMVLQCKSRSTQKPTIKWFRKKEEGYIGNEEHTFESYRNFIESSRSIKYFENFYEPMVSPGNSFKELSENIYLSKLIVNNITQNSIYVCVAINYFGFSYRESRINVETIRESSINVETVDGEEVYEGEAEEIVDFPEKNYEILFLVPVVLLMPISALCCTILYLLINRQILRRNKSLELQVF